MKDIPDHYGNIWQGSDYIPDERFWAVILPEREAIDISLQAGRLPPDYVFVGVDLPRNRRYPDVRRATVEDLLETL